MQRREWVEKDSNLRRYNQQIYSLPHLTALESTLLAQNSRFRQGGENAASGQICKEFLSKLLGLSEKV